MKNNEGCGMKNTKPKGKGRGRLTFEEIENGDDNADYKMRWKFDVWLIDTDRTKNRWVLAVGDYLLEGQIEIIPLTRREAKMLYELGVDVGQRG